MTFYTKTTTGSRPPRASCLRAAHTALFITAWVSCAAHFTSPLVASEPSCRDEPPENSTLEGYEYQFPAMGTLVSLQGYCDNQEDIEDAFAAAEQRVNELAAILTDYDPKSETRQLATRALTENVRVSDELWQVLMASDHWHKKTGGAFDSSLGALTKLWRKYRRTRKTPPMDKITEATGRIGWNNVVLNKSEKTVLIQKEGLLLDFGAIGKGYIVDAAFEVLQRKGIQRCMVNISGNMRFGDAPPEREGWRIEVAPLEKGGTPLRRIQVENCSVATSGDLWQYIEIDGIRRSHILDPATGMGVLGPISATVITDTATNADACATAACVLGPEKSKKVLDEIDHLAILIARKNAQGKTSITTLGDFPEATGR